MADVQQNEAPISTPLGMMHAKKKELMSNAMKRTTKWIFSQDIPSDVTINVRDVSFSLHKFPLVAKCGYMRKLMSKSKEGVHIIEINDIPAGPHGFELAAKFCYGINFELTIQNIAMARCVAEFLEMEEKYAIGNLIARTEAYINKVGLKSLTSSASILQSSETLLPISENVKLVTRCVDSIAFLVMKECEFSLSASGGCSSDGLDSSSSSFCHLKVDEWWAEDLVVLKIHTFQRVLLAMISRGSNKYALGPILTLYAQKCLKDLEIIGKGKKKSDPNHENEKRVVLETIVSLLPREKHTVSVSFLSMLLRSAIHLETTTACRLDLEKRIGLQLGEAILDDILIPSFRFDGDTLFDVDTVQRILMNYNDLKGVCDDIEKVRKLMESYLVEIASDCNFSVSKFINLVECIPKQEKVMEDGMYRVVDIYLKAHPALGDTERKKLCNIINCQNLTHEACAHAAKNDRLSSETVTQVLFYEQQRLKQGIDLRDDLPSLEKENQDLKFELVKVKMRLKEMEISHCDKSPWNRKSFMNTISKKFVKFTPFFRVGNEVSPSVSKSTNKLNKDRRHSIS